MSNPRGIGGRVTTKPKSKEELREIMESLEAAVARKTNNKILFFDPYVKQQQFFDLGMTHRERLLMAGNQLGKSEAGAFEMACHLTGLYPDSWLGRRFDKPMQAWAAGETSTVVRDVQQKKLCGEPGVEELFGTGYIPKHLFIGKPTLARGVTDAFDTIQVRHVSGGISVCKFKSYEQGRKKFQASTLDVIWFDEEPPMDIYSEGLARITATRGMVFVTFTPLQGRSTVVNRYLDETSPDRAVVIMTIKDALHITPEERARIIAGYPAHEREARANGTPMLGSGRIFPYTRDSIWEPRIQNVPLEWAKIWGVDFGTGGSEQAHPFAAVLMLWDRDMDIMHVHHTIRIMNELPDRHAQAMKPVARGVRVAWPQDGTQRESGGEVLAAAYKRQGLRMLPEHATWPEGGLSTEAGIIEMQLRMTTGRLKVADHLSDWFEEFDLYHRKDGQIVKVKDDLLSATRIALMMKRAMQPGPLGGGGNVRAGIPSNMAAGLDFDVFTGQ